MRSVIARAVLCACALFAVAASPAHAVTQVIPGDSISDNSRKLTVYVGDDGGLQAKRGNQSASVDGMFYGDDFGPANQYFHIRIKGAPAPDITYRTGQFAPVSNGPVTGNFTPSSPAQVVTVYNVVHSGQPLFRVTQTTRYVGFELTFRVTYEVTNIDSLNRTIPFIAGTSSDLYIDGSDEGIGIFIGGASRFVGGSNTASLTTGGIQEVLASQLPGEGSATSVPPWASFGEGDYNGITSRLTSNDAFLDTIDPASVDNGVGVSWDDRSVGGLAAGQTARYEAIWHAVRPVPLTASPAQASAELPASHTVLLQLVDANLAPVSGQTVRWRIVGQNPQPGAGHTATPTNESGQFEVTWNGTEPGLDELEAFADTNGNGTQDSDEPSALAKVMWLADNHVVGAPTVPETLTGPSGQLPVGVRPNPGNEEAPTYEFVRSAAAAAGFVPCTFDGRDGRLLYFPLTVTLEPGAGTLSGVELAIVDRSRHDPNATSGSAAPPTIPPSSSSGTTYTFTIDCVTNSDLWVRFTITEGSDSQTFAIPIGGLLLLDPQGVVYDRAAFDAAKARGASDEGARSEAAISGATVRLQRQVASGFVNVLSGDPGIRPNVNPETTGANGLYQWDVVNGTYRVVVDAPGFVQHVSRAVIVPPPVLDLHIPMERPAGEVPVVEVPPIAQMPGAPVARAVAAAAAVAVAAAFPKGRRPRVGLTRKGTFTFGKLACPGTAPACLPAKVTVRPEGRGRGRNRLPGTLGSKTFTFKPGQTKRIRFAFSKSVTRRVRARKNVDAIVTIKSGTAKARIKKIRIFAAKR